MVKKSSKRLVIEPSSGNVFVDLNVPDAAALDIKVRLAVEIKRNSD